MVKDKPIQLVNYNKQGKSYTFNKKALQQTIQKNGVQDLPVSVISVSGLFQTGKSFLLNFFLLYLYAEDRENWLSDSSELLKGFEWRGGNCRHTEGIHIWSKIFKLPTADGSQVAVILMDTQGTFDGKSSNKTGSVIFALSELVSSVQVYNLSSQINENDLDNLLLATQYASFAQEDHEQKSFQSLIFLVRDWQFYQQFPYGEKGGKMLLDEFLEITPDQDPSLTKVRNDIKSTFEKLSCFLLPYPGETVGADLNFKGSIKDIGDEFITHIRKFIPSVLSPNNLVSKQINGIELKCKEFVELFATYLKYYNSDGQREEILKLEVEVQTRIRKAEMERVSQLPDELPDEVSKAETAVEAYYAPLLERCVNVYKTEMMKMLDDCISQVFKNDHERIKTMAMDKFSKVKLIDNDIVSSKHRILTTRIQEHFLVFEGKRSTKYKASAEKHYNAMASEMVKEYNKKINAITDKSEEEIEFYISTASAETQEKLKWENHLMLTTEEREYEPESQIKPQAELEFSQEKLEAEERMFAEVLEMKIEARKLDMEARYHHEKEMEKLIMEEQQIIFEAEQRKHEAEMEQDCRYKIEENRIKEEELQLKTEEQKRSDERKRELKMIEAELKFEEENYLQTGLKSLFPGDGHIHRAPSTGTVEEGVLCPQNEIWKGQIVRTVAKTVSVTVDAIMSLTPAGVAIVALIGYIVSAAINDAAAAVAPLTQEPESPEQKDNVVF